MTLTRKKFVTGVKQRIVDGALGMDYNWPNVKEKSDLAFPYADVSYRVVESENPTLKGGAIYRETLEFNVNVCTENFGEGGEDTGLDLSQSVIDLFVTGTKFNITDGEVRVIRSSSREPYPTDADWRNPTIIRMVATAT